MHLDSFRHLARKAHRKGAQTHLSWLWQWWQSKRTLQISTGPLLCEARPPWWWSPAFYSHPHWCCTCPGGASPPPPAAPSPASRSPTRARQTPRPRPADRWTCRRSGTASARSASSWPPGTGGWGVHVPSYPPGRRSSSPERADRGSAADASSDTGCGCNRSLDRGPGWPRDTADCWSAGTTSPAAAKLCAKPARATAKSSRRAVPSTSALPEWSPKSFWTGEGARSHWDSCSSDNYAPVKFPPLVRLNKLIVVAVRYPNEDRSSPEHLPEKVSPTCSSEDHLQLFSLRR